MGGDEAVLDPEKHERLIRDPYYCELAGIPPVALRRSARDICGAAEIEWVMRHRSLLDEGVLGLCYIGAPRVHRRMVALTAAMLRNFIDARVRSVEQIMRDDGELSKVTALLIPDMQVRNARHTAVSTRVEGLLTTRATRNLVTCVGVQSLDSMETEYGAGLASLLREQLIPIKGAS